jgi:hypothetical protein
MKMAFTRFSIAFIAMTSLVWGRFVIFGVAQAGANEAGLSAQIRLTDGSTKKINKVSGNYVTCEPDDGGSLKIPFEEIKKLEILKGGLNVTILSLGGESVSGKTVPFTVRGEGDWGPCEFMSANITSVVFSDHPQKERVKRNGMSAEVLMPKGNTKKIDSLHSPHKIIVIECGDGDFSLKLSLCKIKRLDMAEGGSQIRAFLIDETVVSGKTKSFSLEGQVDFGDIVFQNSEIKSVTFSEYPKKRSRRDRSRRDRRKKGIALSIQSMGGTKITGRITDMWLGDFDFTMDERNIASLVFPVESKQVRVQTHNGKEYTFAFGGPTSEKHELTGRFTGGGFSIPYSEVTAMALVGSARQSANTKLSRSPDSSFVAMSNIEDMMGNRVEAHNVQPLIGGGREKFDIFFPNTSFQNESCEKGDLDVLHAGHVRYLVDSNTILQNGLQVANGSLSLTIGEQTVLSKESGQNFSTVIRGKTAFGDFRISTHKIRSLCVSQKAGDSGTLYVAEDADATVTIKKGKVLYIKSPILNARNTIRSGYFLASGGRLFRHSSRILPVSTPSGETIMVRFDKIRSLTVEKDYTADKKIRLVSKSGQKLAGSIDLEAVKKPTDETYLSDEGIVGKVSPSIYVFVSFAAIDSIAFRSE